MPEQQQQSLPTLKQNLIEYVKLQLGGDIIDLELDPSHYEAAYQKTIGTYRQRANNAYEESYSFMQLVQDVNIYELPQEVISVCDKFSAEHSATARARLRQTLIRLHRPVSTFT
jgi:hypothetical protein